MIGPSKQQPLFPDVGVIGLVPETWGGMWLSRQQILTRLSRYFYVLWFDPPQSWRKLWGSRKIPLNHEDPTPPPQWGFAVYRQSRLLPKFYRPEFLARFTASARLRLAAAALRRRGCKKIIAYVWLPGFAEALDLVEHDVSCYHIADEYSFSAVERPLSTQEANLLKRVDQVFIHSPALMEKKGSINPNTRYVTNGVDYKDFATPRPEPEDMAEIPHPRVGYIGRLKLQLDWDLLVSLAARHEDYSFVFVGPIGKMGDHREKMESLFARPNVYYLGNKPVDRIAAYTQHMDVCLLCYTLDDYTRYIFPLKLHEYLAAGKPVVGSRIRSLEDFSDVITIADGPDEWSRALEKSTGTGERTPDRVWERQNVARGYDWDALVRKIAESLCERLGGNYGETLAGIGHGGSAKALNAAPTGAVPGRESRKC